MKEQEVVTTEITERANVAMERIENLFGTRQPVVGVVHFLPMIGYGNFSIGEIYRCAKQDLQALEHGGADGVIFENNYDTPHKVTVAPETFASMAALITILRKDTQLPIGVSVLWNDYRAAISIAKIAEAEFIRVPVFVDKIRISYGHVITGDAEAVARYRVLMEAQEILLFTDVHVKHSQILNPDTIEQSAKRAVIAGSDGLIVTGKWTGDAPAMDDLKKVRANVGEFPIILGSGVSAENVSGFFEIANGAIVSTSLKEGDNDEQEINNIKPYTRRMSEAQVRRLIAATGRYDNLGPEILFICEGNVGRSQMAEAYYNALLRPQMLERARSIIVFIEEAKLPEYTRQFREKMTFVLIDDPFGMDLTGTRQVKDLIKFIIREI